MVLAWTGVILAKPMLDTALRIHSAKGGVSACQARGDPSARCTPDSIAILISGTQGLIGSLILMPAFMRSSWAGCREVPHNPTGIECRTTSTCIILPWNVRTEGVKERYIRQGVSGYFRSSAECRQFDEEEFRHVISRPGNSQSMAAIESWCDKVSASDEQAGLLSVCRSNQHLRNMIFPP
jgi:hypothetical protein